MYKEKADEVCCAFQTCKRAQSIVSNHSSKSAEILRRFEEVNIFCNVNCDFVKDFLMKYKAIINPRIKFSNRTPIKRGSDQYQSEPSSRRRGDPIS
jgi:hypothetical protein